MQMHTNIKHAALKTLPATKSKESGCRNVRMLESDLILEYLNPKQP